MTTRNEHLEYNYQKFKNDYYSTFPFTDGSPRMGECAVDFEATLLDGTKVNLSDYKGKTIYLETGSRTCPMFGSNIDGMNELADKYASEDTVFLLLYTREAHPGSQTPAHRDLAHKIEIATEVATRISKNRTMLVDDVQGAAHRNWGQFPNSLWVIGKDGKIKFRTDWNQYAIIQTLLEADDFDATVKTLKEHNLADVGPKLLPWIFGWLKREAGWDAVVDMLLQIIPMAFRHVTTHRFYKNVKFFEARDHGAGGCW